MRIILTVLFALAPGIAHAQIVTGTAKAIDGDTLEVGGERVRLYGIDAPEKSQTCQRDGQAWNCGEDASGLLAHLAQGRSVICQQMDRDVYGRQVSTCTVAGTDLGRAMVESGLAVTLPQTGAQYVQAETSVKAHGVGIWGSEFVTPSEYRSAHPDLYGGPKKSAPARAMERSHALPQIQRPAGVYYRNCSEAREAGVAPIYRGQPGYRPEMDGDNDGIACEPYRGRR